MCVCVYVCKRDTEREGGCAYVRESMFMRMCVRVYVSGMCVLMEYAHVVGCVSERNRQLHMCVGAFACVYVTCGISRNSLLSCVCMCVCVYVCRCVCVCVRHLRQQQELLVVVVPTQVRTKSLMKMG